MSFKVDFIGMVYFVHQNDDSRIALLPNGAAPENDVEPHFASFFLDKDFVTKADWWQVPQKKIFADAGVIEYRIAKPATITISGVSEPAPNRVPLNTAAHEGGLPQVKTVNPEFEVDLKQPESIARLNIRQGTMTALKLTDAAISQLTTEHAGPITIKATTKDGKTRQIELKDGAEIIFSNTSDLFPDKPADGPGVTHESHFQLYAKLDIARDPTKLKIPPSVGALPPLLTDHPYFTLLFEKGEVPRPECSNTCC